MAPTPALLLGILLLATATARGDTPPSATQPAALARISAEEFGALPFMTLPKLSPSGERVVATTFVDGMKRLIVVQFAEKTSITHSILVPEERELRWYRWAGDDQLLMSIGLSTPYFGQDVYSTRLLKFDLRTQQTVFVGKRNEGIVGDDVLYVDPQGRSLLLSIQKTIYDYPSVWNVDLATLKMKEVVRQWPGVWDWFADTSGTVRAGIGYHGRRWWVLYRKNPEDRFEKIIKRSVKRAGEGEEEGEIERFVPLDGTDSGYAVSNSRTGRYGLYHYDFANDELGEPIFEHERVDLEDILLSDSGQLEAIYYTDDRRRIEWLNPKMKAIQSEIDAALPNRINRVTSINRDGSRMLVWTGSASDPGVYYVFHAKAGVMNMLARPYDKIKGKQLAYVESTSYNARDGLSIPAYLTMPPRGEAQLLPLIVLPHGGPFVRDEWGYDVWAQFLANRGYAVLQPNFRGSTGYGKSFVEKGEGQVGRAMQDDLDDGVKWLVEQGKVDPKRVCIMGASYGGYAAMWAAARNPDIYRCAISFAGISDLEAMLKYDRRLFAAPRYHRDWREKVQGDKSFDLSTVSPLSAVDRIGIPLLIAHGSKDDNVPMSQSKKLHQALTAANKPHSYVVYEGEGHGFEDPANAIDFLNRVDSFLQTHNPAQ